MKIKIFLYHQISPESNPLWQPIHPKLFEKQLKYISKKYEVIQLEKFLANGKHKNHKVNLAAIVFDDGYKNFSEYALPLLKKYDAPTSIYVVTNSVASGELIWTYELDYLFSNTRTFFLNLTLGFDYKYDFEWKNKYEQLEFIKKLKPYLKKLGYDKQQKYLEEIRSQFKDVKLPKNLYLNWDELKEIKSRNVYISSHTLSHPMLGSIAKDEVILNELKKSRGEIIKEMGYSPISISYPIGSYNEKVKKLAAEAGYTFGFRVGQETYDSIKDDNFSIPRIELYSESMFKFKLRVWGVIGTINKILKR